MTYFIALGRLFDKRKDTHSIRHFIDVTVENPWIFSRPQLLKRKQSIRSHKNDEPQWLRDYVGRAWEPSKQDLEVLQSDISPWEAKYKAVYKPIRDNVIAHSARRLDALAIQALFALTLVDEMKDMLRDLQTLLSRTWELAWNATPPTRYDFSYHLNYVRDVTEATEDLIKAIDPKARPRQRRTFLTSYAGS